MRHGIFAVFDDKAKAFISPFTLPNQDMAIREFSRSARDPNHMFGVHAEDYSLFRVGFFDDETGVIEATPKPEYIALAAMLKDVPVVQKVRAANEAA